MNILLNELDNMTKRNEFTQRLINALQIRKEMRILDFGCGSGEVTSLLAEKIGENGEIVGLDIDKNIIDIAKDNIKLDNVSFVCADITELPNIGKFDIIIGRRVLMYVNYDEIINKLLLYLNKGGKIAFQESDCSSFVQQKDFKKLSKVQDWIVQCVKKEGGNIQIGSQLYKIYKEHNLDIVDLFSEQVIQTKESGSDLGWVVQMMKERMIKNGIISENEDLEKLNKELEEELNNSDNMFIRDLNYGIIGTKK